MLLKNKLLESNQVFLFKCSSRVLIPTSKSVGEVLHPHPVLPRIGFLAWLNWEVCAEKEILTIQCPLPRSKMRCSASSHTFISRKALGQNSGSPLWTVWLQALFSPCSKIRPLLLPLRNIFYLLAYNNISHQKSPIPRSCKRLWSF